MCTSTGSQESNEQATVPGFGTVQFHKDAIANIFGFGDLVDKYRITYDSEKEDAFFVHMKHKTVKITQTPEGLCQFRVLSAFKDELEVKEAEMTETNNMVQTVDYNKIVFPKDKWSKQRQHESCIIL